MVVGEGWWYMAVVGKRAEGEGWTVGSGGLSSVAEGCGSSVLTARNCWAEGDSSVMETPSVTSSPIKLVSSFTISAVQPAELPRSLAVCLQKSRADGGRGVGDERG